MMTLEIWVLNDEVLKNMVMELLAVKVDFEVEYRRQRACLTYESRYHHIVDGFMECNPAAFAPVEYT
jgi:hypothetical protein